jgi:protochlorophyllide reductase
MKMLFNFGGSSSSSSSKPVCVVTGTTSGLGKETARELLKLGKYEVVLANRNVEKMQQIALEEGFDKLPGKYTVLPLDLGSFSSTKAFVKTLKSKYPKPINRLICNAAVYQPANLRDNGKPRYTQDGFEEQLQINHLSHFLLCNLLLGDLTKAAKTKEGARLIIVGSITGNDNTVGGGVVYPIADLGDLSGLAQGGKQPVSMIDGKEFNGAKVLNLVIYFT